MCKLTSEPAYAKAKAAHLIDAQKFPSSKDLPLVPIFFCVNNSSPKATVKLHSW